MMSTPPNTVGTSQAEKEKLLALLRESRESFLASFAGVSDEQSRRRPAEGSWSVMETVEHLTVAEQFMLDGLTKARRPRTAGAPNREAIFLERLGSRSRKAEAPEGGRPTGRFANLAEAADHFRAARESAIRFLQENNEDLRATEVTHPHPLIGVVSSFEMLISMAKHAERHALQIEEIKNTLCVHADAAKRES
jgi:uncharacterized damage-inducible protein DinB